MPWPVHPNGLLGAQGGDNDTYKIERSLRFNSADSAYLSWTPASAGNRKTFTWSGWLKLCQIPSSKNQAMLFDGNGQDSLYVAKFSNTGGVSTYDFQLGVSFNNLSVYYATPLLRDPSAWYHIVYACDTTQATSSNRIKIYLNGSLLTTAYSNYPAQNADGQINTATVHSIGGYSNGYGATDGYLTEINFIDGQALTPSSFGETDAITGRWKAKSYGGTYGTNGFYLKFADNSGTTATTLGKDSSPNGNNWTPNNFSVTAGAGNDSLIDSPTNSGTSGNYCALNPLNKAPNRIALLNGNLDLSQDSSGNGNWNNCIATHGVTTGKWYWEVTPTSSGEHQYGVIGSEPTTSNIISDNTAFTWLKYTTNSCGYYSGGGIYNDNQSTVSTSVSSFASGDIVGIALDADSKTIQFYKNNSSQYTHTFSGNTIWLPAFSVARNSATCTFTVNFGQRPFAYTAPTGFKALCTTNLPTPTIKKPSSYMDVVTYTGDGTSSRTITGLNFQPELIWIKNRTNAYNHTVVDSVRGGSLYLETNNTNADQSATVVSSFNSNGFQIGTSSIQVNGTSNTYVAWAWDEAPIAGMDIVVYTGNGTSQNISHSLGISPAMIITKARTGSATDWGVYHKSNTVYGNSSLLRLNTTNASINSSSAWNNTAPTSTVFSVGALADTNQSSSSMIAYLFAEVEGFSKFGSYTGNGGTDGPFVWCGFRPRWVMIKNITTAGYSWEMFDTSRDTYNAGGLRLFAESSSYEVDSRPVLDLTSNGFKLRSSASLGFNGSSNTYIFAAFAESAYKYARAR